MSYLIGQRYVLAEDLSKVYVLAAFGHTKTSCRVCLVNLENGNRWAHPVTVKFMDSIGTPFISDEVWDNNITTANKFILVQPKLVISDKYEIGSKWMWCGIVLMLSQLDSKNETLIVGLINTETGKVMSETITKWCDSESDNNQLVIPDDAWCNLVCDFQHPISRIR